ncbi:Ribokinase-like protein [Mucidula mucida]|nr:Ribokinase-like protein [Mucidula mucida]
MSARCLVRGSINIDEFFHVKDIRAGGKGANQAGRCCARWMQCRPRWAIGNDGLWVRSQLKEAGVNDSTGRAIIQLTDVGENSIILYKGANYSLVHEQNPLPRHAETTHVLLQNEIPWSETMAQLQIANDPSLSAPSYTIFNPSPMPSDEQLQNFPWEKLSWLIVNEGEAADLNKALTPGSNLSVPPAPQDAPYASMSAYAVLIRLSQCIPTTNIVCTLGGAGVLAHVPSFQGPPLYLRAARLEGSVRDTTGAGDCFTGYLVAGLMKSADPFTSESLFQVLRRCVQAAGMCVERRGAMESIPMEKEVTARLLGTSS